MRHGAAGRHFSKRCPSGTGPRCTCAPDFRRIRAVVATCLIIRNVYDNSLGFSHQVRMTFWSLRSSGVTVKDAALAVGISEGSGWN